MFLAPDQVREIADHIFKCLSETCNEQIYKSYRIATEADKQDILFVVFQQEQFYFINRSYLARFFNHSYQRPYKQIQI